MRSLSLKFVLAFLAVSLAGIALVALLAGQVTGVLYLSVVVSLLVGLVIWLIAAVLLWLSIRTFARAAILAKL